MEPFDERLRAAYAENGQEHVFRFWDRLDAAGRRRLEAQARQIDPTSLAALAGSALRTAASHPESLAPPPALRLPERGGDASKWDRLRRLGREVLADANVAVLTVAGGQGTRLGFPGPKGSFPIGPVSDRCLFELFAQILRGHARRSGRALPWFVMTSDATDDATRKTFTRANHFGLPPEDVFLFRQGSVPALDLDGRLLLERPDRIFVAPDGHGGCFEALLRSGALERMEERGIDTLFYHHIDNPLVRAADPAYLGFHVDSGADMSCKVVEKTDPLENVGLLVETEHGIRVVEYTEADPTLCAEPGPDGGLKLWAGSIGIHVFATRFVRRVGTRADTLLPVHRAAKRIPTTDEQGRPQLPSEPNGQKFERFTFDALAATANVAVMETRREEEYAPLKNAAGGSSPVTARRSLVARYRRWLAEAGIEDPGSDVEIEMDHSRFDGPEDLRASGIRDLTEAQASIRTRIGVRG